MFRSFHKFLATVLLLVTVTTFATFPILTEQAYADSVSDTIGALGGGLAGAGAGGALGAGVGSLIGRQTGNQSRGALIGGLVGAAVGATAGAIAGANGRLAAGVPGLNLGTFSNYGIHVPQGTVLQANNPQLEPLIVQIINFFLGFVGLIAFLMLVSGGFRYLSSNGDAEATKKGKQTITYAIIGVVVIALSYAATNTLISGIGPQVSESFVGIGRERNFPGFPGVNLGFAVGIRL